MRHFNLFSLMNWSRTNVVKGTRALLLALTLLCGVNETWGNSVTISAGGLNAISEGKFYKTGTGNHINSITIEGTSGYTLSYNSDGYLNLGSWKTGTNSYRLSWKANTGCTISVSKITLRAYSYGTAWFDSKYAKLTLGDVTTDVRSAGTSAKSDGNYTNVTCSSTSYFANDQISFSLNRGGFSDSNPFCINSITIEYTITPDAPTIKSTTASVNVSLSDENKLDLFANTIGVTDAGNFTVSMSGPTFASTGVGGSTIDAHFDGRYFYATAAGKYTYSNPYISAKSTCHEKSGTTTGSVTITVNRLDPNFSMSTGNVDVTTNKSNPKTIDLNDLVSKSGTGAVSYTLLSGPTAKDGTSYKGNCELSGSTFYAWVGGTYHFKAVLAQTSQYDGGEKEFDVNVNRISPNVVWTPSSDEQTTFMEGDVIMANSAAGVGVSLSKEGDGASYIEIEGNQAIITPVSTAGTYSATLKATTTQTDVYASITDSHDITITSRSKQYITWNQTFNKLKTTDATKTIMLNATTDAGLPITYTLLGNQTGVTLTNNSGTWTLTYSEYACTNTMLIATQVGDDDYAPVSMEKQVKIIDPTKDCSTLEDLGTFSELSNENKIVPVDIPNSATIQIERCGNFWSYTGGVIIRTYTGADGTGRVYERSIDASSIPRNQWTTFNLTSSDITKNIKAIGLESQANQGYNIKVSYTHDQYMTPSVNKLDFKGYVATSIADQSFTIDWANYSLELSIEGGNNHFSIVNAATEADFGECSAMGTKTITVHYNTPAVPTEETATLYIKTNTGNTLGTIALSADVDGLDQHITEFNIGDAYKTTDRAELSAVSDRGLTKFSYSATPEGIAQFNGNIMTFIKSGTIAVTVTEPGNESYSAASATKNNIVVSKVTPVVNTAITASAITYGASSTTSVISGSMKDDKGTAVAGTFSWGTSDAKPTAGSHTYNVTFTPTNTNWYNSNTTLSASVQVNKATPTITWTASEGPYNATADIDVLTATSSNTDAGTVNYTITSQTPAGIAEIKDGKLITYNPGTVTVRATAPASANFNEQTMEKTFIFINKMPSVTAKYAQTTADGLKVDGTITDAYTFTNTDANLTFNIESHLSSSVNNGTEVIAYDKSTKTVTALNAGTATLTFTQPGTSEIEGKSFEFNFTVTKIDNPITVTLGGTVYDNNEITIYLGDGIMVSPSSQHKNTPFVGTQLDGETYGTYYPSSNAFYAAATTGNVHCQITQAETYKYAAGQVDFTIHVAEFTGTCNALDTKEGNLGYNATSDVWELSGLGDEVVYSLSKDCYIDVSTTKSFSDYSKIADGNHQSQGTYKLSTSQYANYKYIRARSTGTGTHSYNFYVTRNQFIAPSVEYLYPKKIIKGGTATATFDIDYSVCDETGYYTYDEQTYYLDKRIRLQSNNTTGKITMSPDAVPGTDAQSGKKTISVTYHSDEVGTDDAILAVYNRAEKQRVYVHCETLDKWTPTAVWQYGVDTKNIGMSDVTPEVKGFNDNNDELKNVNFTFTSSDPTVATIVDGKIHPLKRGTTVITATIPANDTLLTASATQTFFVSDGTTVTLKANEGTPDNTIHVAFMAGQLDQTPSMSRIGYTLSGFYTAATGGTKVANADGSLVANTTYSDANGKWTYVETTATLYAQWTANTYTVTFDATGGSSAKALTVTYNSTYGQLPTSTRAGYAFAGWFTDATAGTQVTSTTTVQITSNQTLYAHWTAVTVSDAAAQTVNFTAQAETKTVTLTFAVANASGKNDFNAPTVSGDADWTISNWSYTTNQVTVTVSFAAKENTTTLGDHIATVTLTAKSDNSATGQVTAHVEMTPKYTCTIKDKYYVEEVKLDLQTSWTSSSKGAITYEIVSFTPAYDIYDETTIPAISENRYLSLGQAGTLELKLTQQAGISSVAGSATKTVTITEMPMTTTCKALEESSLTLNGVYSNPIPPVYTSVLNVIGEPSSTMTFSVQATNPGNADTTRWWMEYSVDNATWTKLYAPDTKATTTKKAVTINNFPIDAKYVRFGMEKAAHYTVIGFDLVTTLTFSDIRIPRATYVKVGTTEADTTANDIYLNTGDEPITLHVGESVPTQNFVIAYSTCDQTSADHIRIQCNRGSAATFSTDNISTETEPTGMQTITMNYTPDHWGMDTVVVAVYNRSVRRRITMYVNVLPYQFNGGDWNDAKNWEGGVMPTDFSQADIYVTENDTLNNDIEVHSLLIAEGKTLTIGHGAQLTINATDNALQLKDHGTLYIQANAQVNVNGGVLNVHELALEGGLYQQEEQEYGVPHIAIKSSGSVHLDNPTVYYYLNINFEHFYPFALPFPSKVSDIRYASKPNTKTENYIGNSTSDLIDIRIYDGKQRAINNTSSKEKSIYWTSISAADTLYPCMGYTIIAKRLNGEQYAALRFTMQIDNRWLTYGEQEMLDEYHRNQTDVGAWGKSTETAWNNQAWNFVANPFLATTPGEDNPIIAIPEQTLNQDGEYQDNAENVRYFTIPTYDMSDYIQVPADEAQLQPFWSVFIQAAETGTLSFTSASFRANEQVAPRMAAPATTYAEQVAYFNVSGNNMTDKIGLLISEDYSDDYDMNADLVKMLGEANSLRAYLHHSNEEFAFLALNQTSAEQLIPVSVRIPAEGTYTWSIARNSVTNNLKALLLTDHRTGSIVDLLSNDYVFDAEQGTDHGRFAINAVVQETPTQLINTSTEQQGTKKVIFHNHFFIIHNGVVFDGQGKQVKKLND